MKELHKLVNVVPVIAKADTLTEVEKKKLKTRVNKPRKCLNLPYNAYRY